MHFTLPRFMHHSENSFLFNETATLHQSVGVFRGAWFKRYHPKHVSAPSMLQLLNQAGSRPTHTTKRFGLPPHQTRHSPQSPTHQTCHKPQTPTHQLRKLGEVGDKEIKSKLTI